MKFAQDAYNMIVNNKMNYDIYIYIYTLIYTYIYIMYIEYFIIYYAKVHQKFPVKKKYILCKIELYFISVVQLVV